MLTKEAVRPESTSTRPRMPSCSMILSEIDSRKIPFIFTGGSGF